VDGSNLLIFLTNLWKSSIMFFYDNGQIWVHSVPNRPALDVISAGFMFVGIIYFVKKYIQSREWEDLSLLAAVPILMMPSILSIAFPDENPSLNRSGGAIVPVFIIAAVGCYEFFKVLFNKKEAAVKRAVLSILLIVLVSFSLYQNYDLVFNQYSEQFLANAWNTSEIGGMIADFVTEGNSPDNAFVVPYPYWVDTRLVGINAGFPGKDYALWPEDFNLSLMFTGNKLFILNPVDSAGLELLKSMYPGGREEIFYSKTPDKNFIMYSTSGQ
jgi:hypothetical protein